MRKVARLKKEARESAQWRGHRLTRFRRIPYRGEYYSAHCEVCFRQVVVTATPAPNEIDVGGRAVAEDCPQKGA